MNEDEGIFSFRKNNENLNFCTNLKRIKQWTILQISMKEKNSSVTDDHGALFVAKNEGKTS
jgi:hypothetical protein